MSFDLSPPLIAAIAWAVTLGLVGGLMTPLTPWYRNLRKPPWQPPDWAFGPAWTIILGLAAWAAVRAWGAAETPQQQLAVIIVYLVNGVFHLAWSPLFFVFRRPDWALVEVCFLLASIVALMVVLAPLDALAGALIVPYLLWVIVAARLNLAIVRLNPRSELEPSGSKLVGSGARGRI